MSTVGWLASIQAGPSGNTTALQNTSYLYDLVGNVTQRQNNRLALTVAHSGTRIDLSLRRYEELGIAAFVSVAVVTYVAVRRYVLRSCQIEPRDALERYGHRRDRILLAIQFWSALLIFAAVPFTLLALNRTHS